MTSPNSLPEDETTIQPEEILQATIQVEEDLTSEITELREEVSENRSAYSILNDKLINLRIRVDTVEAGKDTTELDKKDSKKQSKQPSRITPVETNKDSGISQTKDEMDKIKSLVKEATDLQTNIKHEFKTIKRDYSRNRNIYSVLQEEVKLLKRKQNAPTYRKADDPLKKLFPKGSGSKGGGFLGIIGALLSGLGLGTLLKPITSVLIGGVKKLAGGLTKGLKSLLGAVGRQGGKALSGLLNIFKGGSGSRVARPLNGSGSPSALSRIAQKLGPSALRSATANGETLGLGKGIGRIAVRQVAGFIGRGAIAAAAGTIGFPLLIAAAGAAVGFGTYKMAKHFKLNEKLDSFVNKVSGGKFKSINDFLLGIVDGTVGKELFNWIKNKIGTMYEDAITFLKDKVNDVLGVLSPFNNESSDSENGKSGVDNGSTTGAPTADSLTTGGDKSSSGGTSGGGGNKTGGFWNTISSFGKKVSNAVSGLFGGSSDSSSSGSSPQVASVGSGELAWRSITNGKATEITSGYANSRTFQGKTAAHQAIDIAAPVGTIIYSPEDGVFSKNTHASGGNQAFVKGKSGYRYGFAHLSGWIAKPGQQVSAGQPIAKSGNTGRSSGPHIHFSVTNPANSKIDPKNFKIPGAPTKKSTGGPDTDLKGNELGQIADKIAAPTITREQTPPLVASYMPGPDFNNYSDDSQSSHVSVTKRAPVINASNSTAARPMSGGISGSTKDVMNPRGGIMQEIVLASTSQLFV